MALATTADRTLTLNPNNNDNNRPHNPRLNPITQHLGARLSQPTPHNNEGLVETSLNHQYLLSTPYTVVSI